MFTDRIFKYTYYFFASGDVLTSEQAFHFIKSCGPQMISETGAVKKKLVDFIWEELQKNGIFYFYLFHF